MPLNLIRRLIKGSPLTAADHDGNLDALEAAIEGKEASGAAAAAVAAHAAAADPHPGYLTAAEGAASFATAGAIGSSGLTMGPGFLGRETGTGAPQVYLLGSGLAIVGGALTATSSGGYPAFSAPTGFSVGGSGTGSIVLGFAAGYSLPTTASQADWDTAYSERAQWNGSATGLNASTGRASLGLGTAATAAAADFATAAQGAKADSAVQPAALNSYLTTTAAAATYQPLGAVTIVTATGLLTSSGGTTPQISSSIATGSLAGRYSAGTGALEAITIGSGLAISGGALVVTAGGTGTVTSVGLSLPSIFSVTGSPVTTSGTLAATLAAQAANLVFAGPSSGAAAAPTFRALATADLPSIIAPSAELTLPLNAPGSPTARDIYAVADTIRYRDSSNAERLLLNATDNLANLSNTATARSNIGAAASGAIGSSGLTMATARLLGRTTASTGAPEEITVGSGLSLSAGTLTATGGGGGVTFSVYATGNYIQPVQGAVSAGAAMVANNIYLYPFFVWRTMTVDNLGARVTTASAGFSVQLAIYNSTTNGVPTTLLANTVGISVGSTGPINNNVTAFTLSAGQMYWMAMNSDGTPTMMGIGATSNYYTTIFGSSVLADVSSGSGVSIGRTIGQTYNTWPTDLTSAGTTIDTNRRGGLVWLKVATLT